jgi:hypothetical protein
MKIGLDKSGGYGKLVNVFLHSTERSAFMFNTSASVLVRHTTYGRASV